MSEGLQEDHRTALVRFHKKLYRSSAIAAAIEATQVEGHSVTWRRAGAATHHAVEVTGPRPDRVADEIAQLALEQTVLSAADH